MDAIEGGGAVALENELDVGREHRGDQGVQGLVVLDDDDARRTTGRVRRSGPASAGLGNDATGDADGRRQTVRVDRAR